MSTMAKHVISVCIFCFICATHSPCASHAEVTHGGTQDSLTRPPLRDPGVPNIFEEQFLPREKFKIKRSASNSLHSSNILSTQNQQTNSNNFKLDNSNVHNIKRRDTKKHVNSNDKSQVSSSTDNSKKLQNDLYVKKIFTMYGDGDHMTLESFQKLMKKLDLILLKVNDNSLSSSPHNLDSNASSSDVLSKENKTCFDQDGLLSSLKDRLTEGRGIENIDNDTLTWACPALLYGVIATPCRHEEVSHSAGDPAISENILSVCIYSTLAVVLISACGVLGLAIIPVMQKKFYQPLLQFLVALAVGTLAGDALLHLLPHAMGPIDEHRHEHSPKSHNVHTHIHVSHHDDNMWKGFAAMLGLIFLFFMERMITLGAKWRKSIQLKDKMPSRLKVVIPDGNQSTNSAEKQCKHKYSSFPMCYEEITMLDGQTEDHVFRLAGGTDSMESHNNTATTTMDDLGSNSDIASLKLPRHNLKIEANQNMTECPSEANNVNCTEVNKMLTNEIEKDDSNSPEYTVILREHETRHHGHSHAHGHVHSAPKNMSSVAWMVVMGDGLHNFTDGLAIGAAFASSIAGGFSTAVAVFCHELPHELGDFAMLLKAGMSMKQALLYNFLSSVLCLIGNAFGVWLGNSESASQWIFAVAAGMFLYIALVDMIPELSSGHEAEGTLFQCMLHLGGLLLGFGIMALIALYEHDLKSMFHETI